MSILERTITYFNPQKGLSRAKANVAISALKELSNTRKYDAASRNERNTFSYLHNGNAVQEVGSAFKRLSMIGTDLTQNNPLALRVVKVWANNTIGSGVKAQVSATIKTKGTTKQAKKLAKAFDDFCKSPESSASGNKNIYKLQREIVGEMVSSGGIFATRNITKGKLTIQLIEQSRLSSTSLPNFKNNEVFNGIEMNADGLVVGYWFDPPSHTTEFNLNPQFLPSRDVHHVFDAERVNQHLGVSWFASVALPLDRYATLMEAKIMQQQVAACFALIVEEPDTVMGTSASTDRVEELEPALISYVKAGSKPHVINPPKADGAGLEKTIKADVAIGTGLTYEMLTGDYSSTNFASGRMSRSEFAQGLSALQNTTLTPLLDKIFSWYKEIYLVKNGGKTEDFVADWSYPAIQAVNPKEDHELLMSKVRHGMLSPSKACKIGGESFDTVMAQWVKDKEQFGDMTFDIDPSKYARTGNQLNIDDAGSDNNQYKKDSDNGED